MELEKLTDRTLAINGMIESAKRYAKNSKADNTRRAYKSDWNDFKTYCDSLQLAALPAAPETVILYLTHLADSGKKYSTLKRRIATISQAHKLAKHPSPITDQMKEVLKGIKNTNGAKKDQKKALTFPEISQLVQIIPDTLNGKRDKAMILLGYAGFLRRSELCDLKAEQLEFVKQGVIINLGKTKTGDNDTVFIERGIFSVYCPIENLKTWLAASGVESGFIFPSIQKGGKVQSESISTHNFVKILKRYSDKAGIDPTKIGGHSLRAGGATQASLNKAGDTDIKNHGRWKSQEYQTYIRKADMFKNNPSGKLGL